MKETLEPLKETEATRSFMEQHEEWFGKQAQLFQSLGAGGVVALGAFLGRVIAEHFGLHDIPPGAEAGVAAIFACSRYSELESSREDILKGISPANHAP